MSKVYENYLEMEELAADNGWNEFIDEQARLAQEEMDLIKEFEEIFDKERGL